MLPAILTVVAHSKFINFDASKADKEVLLIVYFVHNSSSVCRGYYAHSVTNVKEFHCSLLIFFSWI